MSSRGVSAPFDSTRAMARDPYRWISRTCDRLGTDAFATRLLLWKVVCLRGEAGARLFYDESRFTRVRAAPVNLQLTLFGRGGVQGLDGEAHRHRKRMFLSLLGTDGLTSLRRQVREEWRRTAAGWKNRQQVVFYEECTRVIFRTACAWAGVPVPEKEFDQRLAEVVAMYEHADSVGPRGWWTVAGRLSSQRWLLTLVEQIRRGEIHPPENSAAWIMSQHQDQSGKLLPSRIAAVELLNVIRPLVAVAVYLTQGAMALHQWPAEREKLLTGDSESLTRFAQEVRRYFPFFPSVVARVRQPFDWQGLRFSRGLHVLLDLFGTNHHRDLWDQPEEFRPDRFRTPVSQYQFIPQGGGDASTGHRCPGDGAAIALLEETLDFLIRETKYEVPPQDLALDWKEMPALPKSRLTLERASLRER